MNNLNISIATSSHQSIIFDILLEAQAWLRSRGINQWTLTFTSEWVYECLERQSFFVANIDDVTVAIFRLVNSDTFIWEDNSNEAIYIHSLAVKRGWQGHGIGILLLRWIEAYAAQTQKHYLRLDCMAENVVLCQYYEQAGFEACRIKKIQYDDSSYYDAQLFEKAVRPHKVI